MLNLLSAKSMFVKSKLTTPILSANKCHYFQIKISLDFFSSEFIVRNIFQEMVDFFSMSKSLNIVLDHLKSSIIKLHMIFFFYLEWFKSQLFVVFHLDLKNKSSRIYSFVRRLVTEFFYRRKDLL